MEFDSEKNIFKNPFFQAIQFASEGFWFVGRDGRTLHVNSYLAQMLGYTTAEIGEKPFLDFVAETSRAHALALFQSPVLLMPDQSLCLCKKNGSSLWVRISLRPMNDENGQNHGNILSVLEKSEDERKSHELEQLIEERTSELNASRGFLDSLIDNLPLMVFVKRADNLNFVRFNRHGLELLGLRREEVIGKGDFDFFDEVAASGFVKKDREVLQGKVIVDIEEAITTQKGEVRIIHTKKIPWLGKDGKPEYLLGISEDITEKRKRDADAFTRVQNETEERERAASLERIRLLSEVSVVMNSSLDYHMSFQALGQMLVPAFCDWCTVNIEKEKNIYERVGTVFRHQEQMAPLQSLYEIGPSEGVKRVMTTGKSMYIPECTPESFCELAGAPGYESVAVKLNVHSYLAVPIRGPEKIRGSLSLFKAKGSKPFTEEDCILTEEMGRRAGLALENALLYESAQKALEARDGFLSVASHELKTPITSLKMNLQLAERTLHQDPCHRPMQALNLMKRADQQIDRLVRLVENLLDVSRIRLGKLELQCEKAELSEIIRGVVADYLEPLKAVSCPVSLEIEESLFAMIDRARVEQVMINLLSNVIKYAPGRPVHVCLKKEGSFGSISVRDHGVGISEEQQRRLFERFSRANSSRNISGLGLGLFISKEITESHGGQISVHDGENEGSVFVVKFPLIA